MNAPRANNESKVDPASLIAAGRRALEIEERALAALIPRLDASFARACSLCLDCRGRVIVTGMGKSGHIAGKIAATLASTGTATRAVGVLLKCRSNRNVTWGATRTSPRTAARTASTSSAGPQSLSRKPRAPNSSAVFTY